MPYDYTVKVTNRSKGLYLIDRVPEENWMKIHNTVQEAVTKTMPKQKKWKKAKWFSKEDLQIAKERRSERQGRKGTINPTEYRVLENSKET